MRPHPGRQQGVGLVVLLFTIAVLVGAIVLSQGLSTIGKRAGEFSANQASFDTLHAALTQFAILNRRLPCPAAGNLSTGIEEFVPLSLTDCGSPSGIVPWVTLGLPQSTAIDSWGRMIGYRVFDRVSGFTRANGLNATDCLNEDVASVVALSAGACNAATHENTRSDYFAGKGLTVNDKGTPIPMVGYVLISFGETGLGAYIPNSTVPMLAPSGASKEFQNAGSGGTYWILGQSDPSVPAEDDNHFDDVVSYKLASDVAAAAKVGGRPWPLYTTLDRLNATGFSTPTTGSVNTFVSSRRIAMNGGPVAVSAFAASSTRYISSMVPSANYYSIGAMTTAGGGGNITTANSEGLTFDFRVKRRILKITLASFNLAPEAEQAQLTFYDGATQVAQVTKQGCSLGTSPANFTIDVGATYNKEFTKVDVQALVRLLTTTSSNFSVASIAACQYDDAAHPACTLPLQPGETANPCP